ncbi:MAG: 16S rRNA (guanine(527)-N(7))-methyltransferase RsmG [Spirochaetota bacterium]
MNTDELLTQASAALSLSLDDRQCSLFGAYQRALLSINESLNLTATTDDTEFTVRHIIDSIAAHRYFTASRAILDVGSGGGLPGIPLAILFPQARVTLCESKAKKANALSSMVRELSLSNVHVAHSNVFELRDRFDTITARAFGELSKLADILHRVGTAKARAVCYKGKRETIDGEMAKMNGSLYTAVVDAVTVPFLAEERHIVVLTKRHQGH